MHLRNGAFGALNDIYPWFVIMADERTCWTIPAYSNEKHLLLLLSLIIL